MAKRSATATAAVTVTMTADELRQLIREEAQAMYLRFKLEQPKESTEVEWITLAEFQRRMAGPRKFRGKTDIREMSEVSARNLLKRLGIEPHKVTRKYNWNSIAEKIKPEQ